MPRPPLPADELIEPLRAALRDQGNAVVIAPPGAGKTTRLPPALIDKEISQGRAVVMLQPRRVAARAAAARIAEENAWKLGGDDVGYQVRFDNKTTPRTRLRVLTEGILARRLQSDPLIEDIGVVLLDEFHERSIHTDLALALLREVQTALRPDLKIVVMSATMNPEPVARFLGHAPVLESQGRMFPVEVLHADQPTTGLPCWELAAHAARLALDQPFEESGHVLVFLPGMGEIRRTANLLGGVDAELHVLHSSVPAPDQDRALKPSARRKLILATNIAETSLTIDGVRTVVDTGLARVMVADARLGIERLELRRISLASARQRTGRAGRTAPGRCWRLWTRGEEAGLREQDPPEIHRIDLAATLLTLRDYGADPRAFPWFEPPRADALETAERLLFLLGAIDAGGRLLDRGRDLARLPLHPRLGALLLGGVREGMIDDAALLAALLSERDPFAETARSGGAWAGESDLAERIEWLRPGARTPPGTDEAAVRAIRRTAEELTRIAARSQTKKPQQ